MAEQGAPAAVPIVINGVQGTIAPEQYQAALSDPSLHAHAPSEEEVSEQKYGGLGHAGIAAAVGGLRGLTLGQSDQALMDVARFTNGLGQSASGESAEEATREFLKGHKEAHPYASSAGEIAGTLAPLLATGGGAAVAEGGARLAGEGAALAGEAGAAARGGGVLSGLGRAVRGVGVGPRMVAELGEGVEHAAAGLIPELPGLAGKAIKNSVVTGLQSGVEGGLYNVGEYTSESALNNEELEAEKGLSAFGRGFVGGSILGGGLGAAGTLGGAAFRKVAGKAGDATRRGADVLADIASQGVRAEERAGVRAVEEAENVVGKAHIPEAPHGEVFNGAAPGAGAAAETEAVGAKAAEDAAKAGATREKIGEIYDQVAKAAGVREANGGLKGMIKEQAYEALFNNMGGSRTLLKQLDRSGRDIEGMMDRVVTEGPGLVNKNRIVDVVAHDVEPMADAGRRLAGDAIGAQTKGASEMAKKVGVPHIDVADIMNEGDALIAKLKGELGTRKIVKELETLYQDFGKITGHLNEEGKIAKNVTVDFERAQELRLQAQRSWEGEIGPNGPLSKWKVPLQDATKGIERRIINGMREVDAKAGTTYAKDYIAAKDAYSDWSFLKQMAQNKNVSHNNRVLGMAEHLSATTGASVGGAVGSLFGPVGAGIGATVGAGVGALGARFIKTRGGYELAGRALEAAEPSILRSFAAQSAAMDDKITSTFRKYLSNPREKTIDAAEAILSHVHHEAPSKIKTVVHDAVRHVYKEKAAEVIRDISNPEHQAETIANQAGELAHVKPGIVAAMTKTQMKKTEYLHSQLPPGSLTETSSLQPHLAQPRVSDAEAHAWLEKQRVVTNPMSLLDDMQKGTLTRDKVQAVKETNPKLYAHFQAIAAAQIADTKHEIPYLKQVQLGQLFDLATNPSMRAPIMKGFQASFPQSEGGTPAAPTSKPPSPGQLANVDFASGTGTMSQKIESH